MILCEQPYVRNIIILSGKRKFKTFFPAFFILLAAVTLPYIILRNTFFVVLIRGLEER